MQLVVAARLIGGAMLVKLAIQPQERAIIAPQANNVMAAITALIVQLAPNALVR